MNENLRELMTFGNVDLEEREKFEERYREEQEKLKKLRSKKRFRKRQYKKETLKKLKDMVKRMTYTSDRKKWKTRKLDYAKSKK